MHYVHIGDAVGPINERKVDRQKNQLLEQPNKFILTSSRDYRSFAFDHGIQTFDGSNSKSNRVHEHRMKYCKVV